MEFSDNNFIRLIAGLAFASLSIPTFDTPLVAESQPPNIVFFLVDDLGWTDINGWEGPEGQSYDNPGGENDSRYYHTPSIAKLRNEGMRFANAYAACPFCGPSRASILTGKYPARIGFTNNNTHDQSQGRGPFPAEEMNFTEPTEPDLVRNLEPVRETSIARALKATPSRTAPYLSCSIGKWHLYSEGTVGCGPTSHGFDYNIGGSYRGQPAGGNRPGWDFYRGSGWSDVYFPNLENPGVAYPSDWLAGAKANNVYGEFETLDYLTDALTRRALEFIDIANSKSRPFFLYLSHYGVHSPMQAKRIDSDGDDRIGPDEPEYHADLFAQRWGKDGRHEIAPPEGSTEFHTKYTYASMVKSIDESLGRIMEKLESSGIASNTVVIFTSDNGGVERNGFTSNDPLRSEKTHGYEGGVRVPLIVRGPGVPPNGLSQTLVTGVDFFPTILELAGIGLGDIEEASKNGFSKFELDGVSLVPLFDDTDSQFLRENNPESKSDDGAIFWHVPHYKHSAPYSAVLRADKKYIRYWEDGDNLRSRDSTEDGYFMDEKELYDLSRNPRESGDLNLFDSNPGLARELETLLMQWLERVDAAMPAAVKRVDKDGKTERWYSQWLLNQDPSSIGADPLQQSIDDAANGDAITVFPNRINKPASYPSTPKKITIESAY